MKGKKDLEKLVPHKRERAEQGSSSPSTDSDKENVGPSSAVPSASIPVVSVTTTAQPVNATQHDTAAPPSSATTASSHIDMDDRVCKDVPLLAMKPLSDAIFYSKTDPKKPDAEAIKAHFLKEGLLTHDQANFILKTALAILSAEPNCLHIPAPVNICGDVHGQFFDLKKLFHAGGPIDESTYLFLGDYVDRGYYSMECFLYLLSLKICYPTRVFMLRGNHECQHLTEYFTFKLECLKKYSVDIYHTAVSLFNALPLCAVVNRQFFCVHGGLSPALKSLADIDKINRFQEPPTKGLFCDLLWSDPAEDFDRENSGRTFTPNSVRGCSYVYNFAAVQNFLTATGLLCIIRAHEAQNAGYRMYKRNPNSGFPAVITIFSAPNYVDVYKNKAAILKYDGATLNIKQFSFSPHPYWLPKFMDTFTWSIPFVGEKIMEMLMIILNTVTEEELRADYETMEQKSIKDIEKQRRVQLLNKIRAVSRMARVYNVLRTERESIMELKTLLKSDRLPSGTLALGAEGIRKAITNFDDARKCDLENEHLPPATDQESILAPSVGHHGCLLHTTNESSSAGSTSMAVDKDMGTTTKESITQAWTMMPEPSHQEHRDHEWNN